MKATKTAVSAILVTVIILVTFASTAQAITGNSTPDDTPYVCAVVLFSDVDRQQPIAYCTGILLSPTVVLTAGHSCLGIPAASVCFDKGPIYYAVVDGKLVYSTTEPIYNGTPIAYPEYANSALAGTNNGRDVLSSSDVGVIILDNPVTDVTEFATLPNAGLADTLPKRCYLRICGYGLQFKLKPKLSGMAESWMGTLSCNSALTKLVPGKFAGSDRYLRCTTNPGKGQGGVALGDSGGPVLYAYGGTEVLLAIHSYASNANFAGVSYHCRIDTQGVLSWINGFLQLPLETTP